MKIFEELEGYFSGQYNLVKTFLSLFKLEAKLAGLTIIPLIINLLILFIILITLWAAMMLACAYLIVLTSGSFWLALGMVILINFIALGGLVKYLQFNLKAMSFSKTRSYLTNAESSYDKLENPAD